MVPAALPPLYWRNEQSGVLAHAINAYLSDQTGGAPCTTDDVRAVCEYLQQWINAPCWTQSAQECDAGYSELTAELVQLRADVVKLKTSDEIHLWLMRALDLGIDPL